MIYPAREPRLYRKTTNTRRSLMNHEKRGDIRELGGHSGKERLV